MMEFLVEDLKSVKDGSDSHLVIDSETGEPIAHLHKEFGQRVSIHLHPDFLDLHPKVKNSETASVLRSYQKNKGEALSSLRDTLTNLKANGYGDAVPSSREDLGSDERVIHYHDPETNEKIVGFSNLHSKPPIVNHDWFAKHGVSKEKADSFAQKIAKNYHDLKSEQVGELVDSLKNNSSVAIPVSTADASVSRRWQLTGSPEEASKRHEDLLRKSHSSHLYGTKIERSSPTSFILHKLDSDGNANEHVASFTTPGFIHQVNMHYYGYSSKPNNLEPF